MNQIANRFRPLTVDWVEGNKPCESTSLCECTVPCKGTGLHEDAGMCMPMEVGAMVVMGLTLPKQA